MIPITCWIDASIAPCGGSPSYYVRNHGLAPVATLSRPAGSAAPTRPTGLCRPNSAAPYRINPRCRKYDSTSVSNGTRVLVNKYVIPRRVQ